jgi:hypothetical protein
VHFFPIGKIKFLELHLRCIKGVAKFSNMIAFEFEDLLLRFFSANTSHTLAKNKWNMQFLLGISQI